MKESFMNFKKIGLLILILFGFFLTFKVMHKIKYFIDDDTCVDTGICAEGLRFGKNITTKELKLEINLPEKNSAGIFEWEVE